MDAKTEFCINTLAETIQENDDGDWSYSGSDAARKQDRLAPIIREGLDLSPNQFRISYMLLERKLNSLILEGKQSDNDASEYVSKNLSEFREDLYAKDLNKYQVAFFLNFNNKASDQTPDAIQISDVEFHRLSRGEWQSRFLPDLEKENLSRRERQLSDFLEKSPNDITDTTFTYWFATYRSRDESYAVDRVSDRLELLLAILNYSMTYNRIQTMSHNSGPWPDRWADLRSPFIYLLHSDEGFVCHFWSQDATFRKADKPQVPHRWQPAMRGD